MQLSLEQKKLVKTKPRGHSLLKGVAGSGKTTVGIKRIPFLLNHYCFGDDDRVLFATYNKTLANFIKYLYEKIEDENETGYSNIFFGDDTKKVDIQTIDSLLYKYFTIYKKENNFPYNLSNDRDLKYKIFGESIAEIGEIYKDVKAMDQKYLSFLMDEIDWIKSCQFMKEEEYQLADRLGRMSHQDKEGPMKLMKKSNTRRAIFKLMEVYSKKLKEKGFIDFKDMANIALNQANKKVGKKYTHIIVDECQDLTKVQLEFFKLLYQEKEYSSITFIADTAQSIYPHSWFTKGRSFTSIGFDMTGRSSSLNKNYRTTTQIAKAAYSLIEKDENIVEDENYVKPSLMNKQGTYPVYRNFKSFEEESKFIAGEIRKYLSIKYDLKDIVVIAKMRSQLKRIDNYLEKEGISREIVKTKDHDFTKDKVRLLTMHSIKGLEFKAVFVIGLDKNTIPYTSYSDVGDESIQESKERKLLYVGMTRATELLYLTNSGEASKFLKEIEPYYLKIDSRSRLKRYYPIDIKDYAFKENLVDLYSKEEKVRQWIIREMTNTYGYPPNLLEVEYKIKQFSKTASVDLVVFIHGEKGRLPFIFIEVKPLSTGIEEGKKQIETYMSHSVSCRYGIATDGNELVIINKDLKEIEDIPQFHPSMIPSDMEKYTNTA